MRLKKIVSGILTCAMVITSVFIGDVAAVNAAEIDMPTPVKTYDFNGSLGDGKAVVKGLGDYNGTVSYEAGRTGDADDKAVKLDGYGIKLSPSDLGGEWTVSAWMKPTATLAGNQSILFVGYHNPEKWIGIAGDSGSKVKVWTNGSGPNGESYEWKNVASPTLENNKWAMLTLSYADGTISTYKDGSLVSSGGAADAMSGANQSIWLGVTNWDTAFAGLADDVCIYSTALTARQVRYLYDNKSDEEIFSEGNISATSALTMYATETKKINVKLPAFIESEGITFTYNSADTSVATVSEGRVTGVAEGETTITTTATLGNAVKTASTKITVKKLPEGVKLDPNVAVEYDLSKAVDGKLKDKSGHGNDATIHGDGITLRPVSAEEPDDTAVSPEEPGEMTITDTSYVDLPIGIMDSLTDQEEFTIETTFSKSSSCGKNAWLFCFGSDPKEKGTNYMFLSPNYDNRTLRGGIHGGSSESLFGTQTAVDTDNFHTVDMVFDHGVVKLYWDGVLVKGDNNKYELNTGFSIMDNVVTPGTKNNILGYIGKSCWSGDGYFNGTISSFRILNKAVTDEDIAAQHPEVGEQLQKTLDSSLDYDDILGNNRTKDAVKYNLHLPKELNEMNLTWTSSEPDAISTDGVVKNGSSDADVTLTATLTSGAFKAIKNFYIKVLALDAVSLNSLLSEANELVQDTAATEASINALKAAIIGAEAAIKSSNQVEVDSAEKELKKAIDKFEYPEFWLDPFVAIDEEDLNTNVEIAPGEEKAVFALPEEIKDMVTVSYVSSDETVAKTDAETGLVTGLKAGYSRVTATVKAKSDNFEMEYQTLVKVDFDMSKVTVEAEKSRIAVGETTGIKVTLPEEVKITPVVTGQANNAFVSVDEKDGIVSIKGVAEGAGSVTIIVRAGGKMKEFQVPVEVAKDGSSTGLDLSGVTASAAVTSIVQGSTTKITVSYPAAVQAANPSASYEASGAVSVDKNGIVTGNSVGSGTVTVTVTAGGKTIKLPAITITVTAKSSTGDSGNKPGGSDKEDTTVELSKITVKAKATKIAKGKTTTISITYPNAATKAAAKVTYKASKSLSVNKSGKVTGKKSGKGTVTVTIKASGQKTVTKKITINVGEISGKTKVKVKKSITLKVKGISGKVKWSVNKKKLASINSKGKLKAKKAGKVKVTAKVGKVTMTKTITIKK